MKKTYHKHPQRLRIRLLRPLAITFLILWVGTMVLITNNRVDEIVTRVRMDMGSAQSRMDEFYNEFYERNLENGLGVEAKHIMSHFLSELSTGQVSQMDGGMALVMRAGEGYAESQLSWGWGYIEGPEVGQRWYLTLDEGLDDQGQLDLAQWITHNREGWDYTVNSETSSAQGGEKVFARVTGVERPGYEILVQRIEIFSNGDTVDTMVETEAEGPGETWDFAYIKVQSVLLPPFGSNGKDVPINVERRLSSFREAQNILHMEMISPGQWLGDRGTFVSGSYDDQGVLRGVSTHVDYLHAAQQEEKVLYLSSAVLTIFVLMFLSAKLSKEVLLPVEELSKNVKEGRSLMEGPIEELNTLGVAFEQAKKRVEEELERERSFTRSAAHELKTPLAILRAHAESAKENINPLKREVYLDVVLEECDNMANLVGSLLDLSRLESGLSLSMEEVDLAALIKEVWFSMNLHVEKKNIKLQWDLEEGYFRGDPKNLHTIVSNLASNAISHTPQGGTIKVSLFSTKDQVIITVDNEGMNIAEEHLEKIWTPFYRVDASRNREDGGTGLGLAIVRAAVQAQGGSCSVTNREGGVCFQIVLPKSIRS
ncbi:Signal transduction histidine kinase [Proteiniclasticum ruminis]|uniref:histidine kinase n=2 Tax=Proteiniclasticum ruminis TaxID=398199 RepID=A0A1G8R6D5_9CLOT|nr:Signal transduction histidine kinase [Proteiniclasticum ruminis]